VTLVSGDSAIHAQPLDQLMLYYLASARADACFASRDGGRVLLIGGPPFPETILMWWNFVARTQDEIMQARADWEDRRRFGEVNAYSGSRLAAPPLARLARPNPMS
jgi:redox-sensitive bicupin YhaK (pirin superfamily)